ncbi:MAG: glycerol kinase [Thermoplasmata archaeon]|nr:glycerol kinase [Thermoplasmata archaeon]
MTDERPLIGLDVGTTSVRSVRFDKQGRPTRAASARQRTRTPRPGWVEQDAEELYRLAVRTLREVAPRRGEAPVIGVTNQRESLVAIDARTGRPLAPVIVWQDTRTEAIARELSQGAWGERVWDKGGLPLTTYPTAPKMLWLLRHDASVRKAAEKERLLLGTVDSWIIYRLLGGARGGAPWTTDASNASRTLLYDLEAGGWSDPLLEHFRVARGSLPEVRPSFGTVLGEVSASLGLPRGSSIGADLGDQQAGLLGVGGLRSGAAKLTFGTGAFFLAEGAPAGSGRRQGLIRTILYEDVSGKRAWALEGGVGAAGSFLDWLCGQGIGLFEGLSDLERAARQADPQHGLLFLPAFAGLFAPHWKSFARGSLLGLSRATSRNELALAAFEGIAHRVADILESYEAARGGSPPLLWTDGGLSRSSLLLQLVADLSGVSLSRSPVMEATARGAALAAGLTAGVFGSPEDLPMPTPRRRATWRPQLSTKDRREQRSRWASFLSSLPGPFP